ncbi:MAG: glycoside hydrolase family 16 protein [Bacteroidales bacterium]|nr:glycoside hydrolase family 16 protein [Bacteroidales bacterium]
MKAQYLFLIFCIVAATGYGQVAPNKDKNWVLNRALSDEFNGTSLDTAKWTTDVFAWYATSYPRNVTIVDVPRGITPDGPIAASNRMLRMTAERNNSGTGWDGSTGGVVTKNANYLYGYYEIRAKLPGYWSVDSSKHCSRGFWPTFYTYHQVRDPEDPSCIIEHEEIDIIEPNGYKINGEPMDNAQSNSIGHGMIDTLECAPSPLSLKNIHGLPPVYENFHKYAAECLPDRIIFYFDDVPIHTVYKGPFPFTLMRVVICNQLHNGSDRWLSQAPNVFKGYNTPWPIHYDVDYFRYYQLNTQYCNTDALIANNAQLASFIYGVRRNITIGNGSAAISLNAGGSVTFRATNDVTINGEFTVPLGCEFNIIPTPCH